MVKGVYYRTDWAEEAGLDLDRQKAGIMMTTLMQLQN